MKKTGNFVSADNDKAEELNKFLASAFTGSHSPNPSRVDGPKDMDKGSKVPPADKGRPGLGSPEEPKCTSVYGIS